MTEEQEPAPAPARREVRVTETVQGDAYGWLGFWLAVGLVLSMLIAVDAYNHNARDRLMFDCGTHHAVNGVCPPPAEP